MIVNDINLVELVADEGKLLTDKERTGTFKKITVLKDKINDYIEVSLEEAEVIETSLASTEE